jgi:hypothetical protein
MKTFLLCFLILFSVCSCNKQQEKFMGIDVSQMEEIVIDAQNGIFLPTDSCIEKMEYIKLETTDDNLIGKISQVLFADSLLVVVDADRAMSINVFDMKGRFKYTIGQKGRGPAEYITITNVALVPNKKQIALLDGPQHKVIHYSYEGKYISSERIPFMLYYYEYLESGNKAFDISGMKDPAYGKYRDNVLLVTDDKNEIIYGACTDFRNEKFRFGIHEPLRKFGKEVYYSPSWRDTIFLITDTSVCAKYYINIVWNGMPKINKDITDEMFDVYREKYFRFNGNYIELKDLTFMNITTPARNPFLIYSHKTKKTYLNSAVVNNPFYAFLNNNHSPVARYKDNAIVFDVQAYHVLASKENLYNDSKYKEELDTFYEGIGEDDNPILFLYYLNTNL